jgi:hypothetical protein
MTITGKQLPFIVVLAASVMIASDYKPPAVSAALVRGIAFDRASPVAGEFLSQVQTCDQTDACPAKSVKCKLDPSRCSAILRFPNGAIFFQAKMGIDADGSAYAKAREGDKINSSETSLKYSDGSSLDSDSVSYIVLPGGKFGHETGIAKGDVAVVIFKDKLAYAVVGDVGPICKIGEGSIHLHSLLGHEVCRKRENGVCTDVSNSSIASEVLYFVFPKASVGATTPDAINAKIETLAKQQFEALKEKL